MSQTAHALHLLQSGALLITTGLIWGLFIPKTPFPRAALSAHMNLLQHGFLSIAAGLLLQQIMCKEWQVLCIAIPHYYVWLIDASLIANSWWGTNKTLPILAKEAGANGGKTWQEVLIKVVAYGAIFLVLAWGILAFELLHLRM